VNQPISTEPSLFDAAWKYRWMILIIATGFAVFAFLAASLVQDRFVASSILVVEDPRASQLFDTGGIQAPDRYVQDQVAILQSTAVATRATEIAASPGSPLRVDTKELIEKSQIASSRSSNVIEVRYTDSDAERAIVLANAVAEAYQEVRRTEALASFVRALEELDVSIAALDSQLVQIQGQIEDLSFEDPARSALFADYELALARMNELQGSVEGATSAELDLVRVQLDDVLQQLQTLQLVLNLDAQRPGLVALLNQREDVTGRRSVLAARRAQLEVDAELSSGVALYFPSTAAESAGLPLAMALVAGFGAGGLVGVGLAYLLTHRRQAIETRSAPQAILSAPLLAEIPDFEDEGLRTVLPVYAAPRSVAAEAFRFAAAAVGLRMETQESPEQLSEAPLFGASRSPLTTLAVVSADEGDGKSVVVANTALASCWAGNRVLVIDADFGAQAQTHLLLSAGAPFYGLTDVITGEISLAEAVQQVELTLDSRFDLLTRGQVPVSATDLLRSEEAARFFAAITAEYDLVLIDTPPLLRVAYSSILARHADRVLVVVPHLGLTPAVEEVRDRLGLVGTPIAGYVYNKAPLEADMQDHGGSTLDVLRFRRDESDESRHRRRNR
jgi:tyrosine-protein kinase Etk/Wzc